MARQQGSGRGLLEYTIEDLTHVWTETNDRARQIVEEIAFGIHSPRPMNRAPYSTEDEGGVMQFGEWYSNFTLELFRVGRKLVLVTIHREHNGMSALHEGGGPIATIITPEAHRRKA